MKIGNYQRGRRKSKIILNSCSSLTEQTTGCGWRGDDVEYIKSLLESRDGEVALSVNTALLVVDTSCHAFVTLVCYIVPCQPHSIYLLQIALQRQTLLRFSKGAAVSIFERGLQVQFFSRTMGPRILAADAERYYYYLNKKHIFLPSLKAQDWTLYDAPLARHLKDLISYLFMRLA